MEIDVLKKLELSESLYRSAKYFAEVMYEAQLKRGVEPKEAAREVINGIMKCIVHPLDELNALNSSQD